MTQFGKVFILGDSYSTFEGYIPKEYAFYYSAISRNETDVVKVDDTWWYPMLLETNSTMVLNCSYSGTTICHTGYDGEDCSNRSFVARFDCLAESGFFKENKIDTFFLFGGTNDSWANSPLGELKYSDWTKEDMYSTFPAFCYLLDKIKLNLPDTNIICIINDYVKKTIIENFQTACDKYGVKWILLHNIDRHRGHPTIAGMKELKRQVIEECDRFSKEF